MQLFNSLTKQIENVKPLSGRIIRIYSCGPTVYDRIHIGNLSAFIYADTLRRVLKVSGFKVKHAMNITDVEDKIIAASQKINSSDSAYSKLKQLTSHFEKIFFDDFTAVGGKTSDIEFIRATDSIDKMQELILKLLASGFAYIAEDGIYFSVESYIKSGKIYGQLSKIDITHSKHRIQNDEYDKSSAQDFALWKLVKQGEPSWPFEIDSKSFDGRPGWHIECSAMSKGALGQPFDIHTGGIDLIFPHHENEIAQSTAATDNPLFASLFFHNQHLLIDGQKMSKSLHNFYTLEDIVRQGHEPLALRVLVLQAHYRSQINFTFESLSAAANRLDQLKEFADLKWQANEDGDVIDYRSIDLVENLKDDLNTPKAWEVISSVVSQSLEKGISSEQVEKFDVYLKLLDELLGLGLSDRSNINEEQKKLLSERIRARASSNWSLSDELRLRLERTGLKIRDLPNNKQIWSRV